MKRATIFPALGIFVFLFTFLFLTNVSAADCTPQGRTGGAIEGSVSLQGEADHTGILVLIENRGVVRIAVTDESGTFCDSGAPPGNYQAKATLHGYQQQVSTPFRVTVGRTSQVEPMILRVATGGVSGYASLADRTNHSGIVVVVDDTSHADRTGPSGQWSIQGILAGRSYTVRATYRGYHDAIATDQYISSGEVKTVPTLILHPKQAAADNTTTTQAPDSSAPTQKPKRIVRPPRLPYPPRTK